MAKKNNFFHTKNRFHRW